MSHQVQKQRAGYIRANVAMNVQDFLIRGSDENPSMLLLQVKTIDGTLSLVLSKSNAKIFGQTIRDAAEKMPSLS